MTDEASDDKKKPIVLYPILVQIEGPTKGTGQILRIAPVGLQFETALPIKTSDRLRLKWNLPISFFSCDLEVLVVKTYENYISKLNGKPATLVEAHFRNPNRATVNHLNQFFAREKMAK
jgi:hypothetical protein